MLFTHDTTDGLLLAADLVNTRTRREDVEAGRRAVDLFIERQPHAGKAVLGLVETDRLLTLRNVLQEAWQISGDAGVADIANKLMRDSGSHIQLTRHDDSGWHFHVTNPSATLHKRIAAQAGMALADLVQLHELARLKTCVAPECDGVLVDLSRNRSRIYCDIGNCGNRIHVAAYRARSRR